MESSTPPDQSLRDHINCIRTLFADISRQCKLEEDHEQGLLHPLGQINVVEARSIFQDSISQMRDILHVPAEDKTTRGLRTRLHEKAQLSLTLQNTKKELQKCCQLGERHLLQHGKPSSYGENPISYIKQFEEWMRSVARQVGFEVDMNMGGEITDPHGDNQISMYSKRLIVIDIMMHKEQVTSVLVTSGNSSEVPSDELCQLLKERYIEEFTQTLAWMMKMETLMNPDNIPSEALSVMEKDLLDAYEIEKAQGSDYSLLQGHGIVERRAIALQITYYGTPVYLKKSQEEQKKIRFLHRWLTPAPKQEQLLYSPLCSVNRLFVTLEKYSWKQKLPTEPQLLPSDSQDATPQWKKATNADSQESDLTNVGFSLELDPPVPMSVHFHWLSKLTLVPSSGFTEISSVSPQNSFLAMLKEDSDDAEHWNRVVDQRTSEIRVSDTHSMTFAFSGPPTRAIRLCHIPFDHPRSLLPLLNPLRQQIVFNELIQSCIRPLPQRDDQPAPIGNIMMEIVFHAPHKIELLFVRNQNFVQIKIEVESGGNIHVDFPEDEQLASQFLQALQATHHIPLSLCSVLTMESPDVAMKD